MKLLIVEDDDVLRSSMEVMLASHGFQVDSAPEGKTALKKLREKDFEAIILDDNIPFIQGSDLLGLIRIQSPNVKIIVMSGIADQVTLEKIRHYGVASFLEKPFDIETVVSVLRS